LSEIRKIKDEEVRRLEFEKYRLKKSSRAVPQMKC
jgi:hypothetical protein